MGGLRNYRLLRIGTSIFVQWCNLQRRIYNFSIFLRTTSILTKPEAHNVLIFHLYIYWVQEILLQTKPKLSFANPLFHLSSFQFFTSICKTAVLHWSSFSIILSVHRIFKMLYMSVENLYYATVKFLRLNTVKLTSKLNWKNWCSKDSNLRA